MKHTTKIVLSGGPGGGKSEAIKLLENKLTELGFSVFCTNEAATELLSEGFDREGKPAYEFQKEIAKRQLKHEAELEALAENRENAVIIFDRGLMDSRVYLNDAEFERLKTELGLCEVDLRDRYDAVFHMDSTSSGENTFYSLSEARTESRDSARKINERSLRAWCGNPHYRFIPVMPEFEAKFKILLREVKAFLGIPKPLEIERKYLIRYPDLELLKNLVCSKSHIRQTYLDGENGRFRLRERGENDRNIYILTKKEKISELVRVETEKRISREEYETLLAQNTQIGTIEKDRYCLMHGGVYYEIDVFPFWTKQAYMEVELLSQSDPVIIPDFITLIREITYDPAYKNSSLCRNIPAED